MGRPTSYAAWWAVLARFAIHGLVVSTWISRIPAIKSSLDLSDGDLGLALLGVAVGSIVAIPVCGWLITRIGSKRATIWTSYGLCLTLLLPGLAISGATLFGALTIFGAMLGANDVAMNANGVSTEKFIGTPTMSRFHAMFSAGGMLGAGAGALAASHGLSPFSHFAIAVAANLIFAAATSSFLIEAQPDPDEPRAHLTIRNAPRALLVLSAIGFCFFLSEGAIADWTAVYFKQVLGATVSTAAWGYGVFSAAMAIFRLCGDAIVIRIGRDATIRNGAILAAFGLTTAILAPSPAWAFPGFALVGAGFSSIIPLVFAAGGSVPGVGEGPGVATVSGIGYLGFLVGPPAIGFISEATSLRVGLLVIVGLSLLAAGLVRFTSSSAHRTGAALTRR